MPNIRTAISIGQPIDRVFEFVTIASNCPLVVPISVERAIGAPTPGGRARDRRAM